MKITKTRVGLAAVVTAVSGIIMALVPQVTSVVMEIAIFQWKLCLVLFAVMLCLENNKE